MKLSFLPYSKESCWSLGRRWNVCKDDFSLVCLKSVMKVPIEQLPRSQFLILNHCSAEPMDSSCCIWFSGVVTFFAESNIHYGEQIIAAGGLLSSPFSEKRVPLPKEITLLLHYLTRKSIKAFRESQGLDFTQHSCVMPGWPSALWMGMVISMPPYC